MPGWKDITVSAAMCGLAVFFGYFADRSHFFSLLTGYLLFFALYFYVLFVRQPSGPPWRFYLLLGLVLRVILVGGMPLLSEDIYRFIWDGRLSVQGIHPFSLTPDQWAQSGHWPAGITPELYERLNSRPYYTVYPPLCQAVFALAALISPGSLWGAALCIKLFLLAAELGLLYLLWRCVQMPEPPVFFGKKLPEQLHNGRGALLYALNPLVLVEISGNAHFEGAVLCFMALSVVALHQNRLWLSALLMVLAIGAKLLPLMLVPALLRWLGWRQALVFGTGLALWGILVFAPMLQPLVFQHFTQSIDLYFREFQFNASLYYIVREIGYHKIGWDIGEFSGPRLGALSTGLILLLAVFTRPRTGKFGIPLPDVWLYSSLVQLFCAATVHPWYVLIPLGLGLFSRVMTPLWWSCLVVFSYSHYAGGLFQEHFGWIILEYSLLLAGICWFGVRGKSFMAR